MQSQQDILKLLAEYEIGVKTMREVFMDFPASEARRQKACLKDASKCVRSYFRKTARHKR